MSKDGLEVRKHRGRYFMDVYDFFHNPTKVYDEVLPKCGTIYITRYKRPIMKVSQVDDLTTYAWEGEAP